MKIIIIIIFIAFPSYAELLFLPKEARTKRANIFSNGIQLGRFNLLVKWTEIGNSKIQKLLVLKAQTVSLL